MFGILNFDIAICLVFEICYLKFYLLKPYT